MGADRAVDAGGEPDREATQDGFARGGERALVHRLDRLPRAVFAQRGQQIAAQAGASAQASIAYFCSQQPVTPQGVSIEANIADTSRVIGERQRLRFQNDRFARTDASTAALDGIRLGEFADRVRTGGIFDFKTGRPEFEPFGNFHFGALGRALGISRSTLVNGAGGAQLVTDIGRVLGGDSRIGSGIPFLQFPFGDALDDNPEVNAGVDAFEAGCFD